MEKTKKYFCKCNQIYAYQSDKIDAYLTELLAPLKEVWDDHKYMIRVLTEDCYSESVEEDASVEMWEQLKCLAERLNW